MGIFSELDVYLNLCSGFNNLSSKFLFECRTFYPTHRLFNQSLTTCVFPKVWESIFISPILKKGNRSSMLNYRPISKISIIPKLFTKIIHSTVRLIINNVLNDH